MKRRNAFLLISALAIVLASSALTRVASGRMQPAARAPGPFDKGDHSHLTQVRAQYVDLNGNRDESTTTLDLVNSSLTKTIVLDEIDALGLDGVNEVLAADRSVHGVTIPPLGTFELVVDSTNFPGLQPELEIGDRGVETVVVSWDGPRDALRLTASIYLQQPGSLDNRVITVFTGNDVTK